MIADTLRAAQAHDSGKMKSIDKKIPAVALLVSLTGEAIIVRHQEAVSLEQPPQQPHTELSVNITARVTLPSSGAGSGGGNSLGWLDNEAWSPPRPWETWWQTVGNALLSVQLIKDRGQTRQSPANARAFSRRTPVKPHAKSIQFLTSSAK